MTDRLEALISDELAEAIWEEAGLPVFFNTDAPLELKRKFAKHLITFGSADFAQNMVTMDIENRIEEFDKYHYNIRQLIGYARREIPAYSKLSFLDTFNQMLNTIDDELQLYDDLAANRGKVSKVVRGLLGEIEDPFKKPNS